MWLYFFMFAEAQNAIQYGYSRESKELDGRITYDKETKTVTIDQPCRADRGSEWAQDNAKVAFTRIINEGFPKERMIVYG